MIFVCVKMRLFIVCCVEYLIVQLQLMLVLFIRSHYLLDV